MAMEETSLNFADYSTIVEVEAVTPPEDEDTINGASPDIVMQEIIDELKEKPNQQKALKRLDEHTKELSKYVVNSSVIGAVIRLIKEDADYHLANSAWSVLAQAALSPTGRYRIRLENGIPLVVKFLASVYLPSLALEKVLGLTMSLASDKPCRTELRKLHVIKLLMGILSQCPVTGAKYEEQISGILMNMATSSESCKREMAQNGGISTIVALLQRLQEKQGACSLRLKCVLEELRKQQAMITS